MWEKLKAGGDGETWYLALVLILVAVASYGLGRLSVSPATGEAAAVKIIPAHQTAAVAPAVEPPGSAAQFSANTATPGESVVASKNGTRYHLLTCPGAKQITEANRITFASRAAAEAAGYTPASNCPGL